MGKDGGRNVRKLLRLQPNSGSRDEQRCLRNGIVHAQMGLPSSVNLAVMTRETHPEFAILIRHPIRLKMKINHNAQEKESS